MKVKETIRNFGKVHPVRSTTIRMMSGRQQVVYCGSHRDVPKGIADRNVMARVCIDGEVRLWISTKS